MNANTWNDNDHITKPIYTRIHTHTHYEVGERAHTHIHKLYVNMNALKSILSGRRQHKELNKLNIRVPEN